MSIELWAKKSGADPLRKTDFNHRDMEAIRTLILGLGACAAWGRRANEGNLCYRPRSHTGKHRYYP